jgi:hypothetical protein
MDRDEEMEGGPSGVLVGGAGGGLGPGGQSSVIYQEEMGAKIKLTVSSLEAEVVVSYSVSARAPLHR